MPEHINPYIAGAPVVEKKMFFGREDVFAWVQNSLSGKYVDHILVLHGQRRVGKTSVLKHLPNRLPDRYIPIFIDLQGRVSTTLGRFLGWLAREIVKALNEEADLSLERPNRRAFEEDPDYFEQTFLPQIEQALGDRRLLLTFDEFDTLETTEAQEGLAMPFMAILKRLMEQKKLNFVFSIGSSGRKLENMQAAYTSFFKQALYRKISFLTERDTHELITKPAEGVVSYSAEAIARITRITSSHPYFVQLMCHELFSLCQRRDAWQVEAEDVESVLDTVIERGTVNLKFVWDEASDLEKWSLAALATFEGGADLPQLETFLRKHQVRFTRQGLESALLHLREKDVLTDANRFVVHLMRLWLLQNRPMEQVREELEEQNPIVTRLLEIAQEYQASGEYQRAIENYEDALDVDPDNLEVHLGLGSTHLARGDFGRAAHEFELVLETAADDVVAQKGYSDAYTELGDAQYSEGKLDEADYAYQQVLTINPQHTSVLQRLAFLHHRRAVAAITASREQALEELQAAQEYSDQLEFADLAADVKALLDGEKQLSEVLRLWGERATSLELWEEARELFTAYQRESGDKETVANRLQELDPRIRAMRLERLRRKAERSEALERKQEALETWQAYLALEPKDAQEAQAHIADLQAQIAEEAQARRRGQLARRLLLGAAAAVALALAGLWFMPDSPLQALFNQQPDLSAETEEVAQVPEITLTPTAVPLRWTRVNSGDFLPRDRITQIATHPSDAGVVYVGTENSGVYKTINGGNSWSPAQEGLSGGAVNSLVIDPQDPNILFAGISASGLFKSTDGGVTWRAINGADQTLLEEQDLRAHSLALDPNDHDHLFVSSGARIFESLDGGLTWARIGGTASGCVTLWIGFSPDGSLLYRTVSACGGDGDPGWIDFSDDGGRSWQQVFTIPGHYTEFAALHFDAANALVYYAAPDYAHFSEIGSQDWQSFELDECEHARRFGGDTQTYCLPPPEDDWRSALAIFQGDPDTVYTGGNSLYKSEDGGATWTEIINGIGNPFTQLLIDPYSQELYLEVYPDLYCDPGHDPKLYASAPGAYEFSLVSEEGCRVLFGDQANQVFRFRYRDGVFQYSTDAGRTFIDTSLDFRGDDDVSLDGAGILFTGTQSVMYATVWWAPDSQSLHYSYDLGQTWEESEVPASIALVIPSPVDPANRWYGLHSKALSTWDSGQHWMECHTPDHLGYEATFSYTAIAPWPVTGGGVFVATRNAGLLHSSRNVTCIDLQPVGGGLDSPTVYSVVINPANPNIVYAGTYGGFYISYNGGETWGPVNDGLLGALAIYSIAVDPQNPEDVYASTPYGIFKLEDR